jgi:hypothetical protein
MNAFFGLGITIAVVAAWFTHIFDCLITHSWGLLIAGALLFPIGIIHGFGVWFGFWA